MLWTHIWCQLSNKNLYKKSLTHRQVSHNFFPHCSSLNSHHFFFCSCLVSRIRIPLIQNVTLFLSLLLPGFAVQGQSCLEGKGLNCYWLFLLVSLIGSALSKRDYGTQSIILHIIFLSRCENGCRIVEVCCF